MSESDTPLERLKKELADCKAEYEITKDERDDYRRQLLSLRDSLSRSQASTATGVSSPQQTTDSGNPLTMP